MLKIINDTSIPRHLLEPLVSEIITNPILNGVLLERLKVHNVQLTIRDFRHNDTPTVDYRTKCRIIFTNVFMLTRKSKRTINTAVELSNNILHESLEASGLTHNMMAKLGKDFGMMYKFGGNEPEAWYPDWLKPISKRFITSLQTLKPMSKVLLTYEAGNGGSEKILQR